MDSLYVSLARWLTNSTNGSDNDYEIYKYGFQAGIEQGLFVITCIIIALFLNVLGTMLLFLLVFHLVRPYIGGFHFKKFQHCYLLSVILACGVVLLSKYIVLNIKITFIAVVFLVSVTFICLLLQSRNLEIKQYQYYKKKLILNLGLLERLTLISYLFAWQQGINVSMLTLVLIITSFVLNQLKRMIG